MRLLKISNLVPNLPEKYVKFQKSLLYHLFTFVLIFPRSLVFKFLLPTHTSVWAKNKLFFGFPKLFLTILKTNITDVLSCLVQSVLRKFSNGLGLRLILRLSH